jgi:L-amino acid N-acyltransferase YncA
MTAAPSVRADGSIRGLSAGDLERVIAIDRAHSGQARRRFFERRFAAARIYPDDHVLVGASTRDGAIIGFAVARILRGEFGQARTVAVLDAIGVEAASQDHGVGRGLLEGLADILKQRGVRAIQSETEWTNHALLRFFHSAGFKLAPRLALERSTAVPLDEPDEET